MMSSLESQQKSKLRKELIQRRDAFSSADRQRWDQCIISSLEAFASQQNVQHVFLFFGYKSEPRVQEWARRSPNGRVYYLPVVRNDGQMGFVRWQLGDAMVENRFGISEPTGTQITQREIEKLNGLLIVVPALSVDGDGFRLGYGGGFYDRFLAEHKAATAVAVTYAKLCVERIPREPFDVPVTACITEDGIQSF